MSALKEDLSREVTFSGYYGMQNIGDDVFCHVSAWAARNFWNTQRIRFLSPTLPESPMPGTALLAPRKRFKGQYALQSMYHALSSRSPIVFAGGSVFHSANKILSSKWIINLGRRLRRRTVGAIGVSLGPFHDAHSAKAVEDYLRTLSFLVVRDKRSYDLARSMDLSCEPVLAADLAFLLPKCLQLPTTASSKTGVIGVSLCNYERFVEGDQRNEQRRNQMLTELLVRAAAQEEITKIVFFVLNENPLVGDYILTQETMQRVRSSSTIDVELVRYRGNIRETWLRMTDCDVVVSTRLHGAVLSCAANIPFLLVEYHQKCSDFLDDLGVPESERIGDMDETVDRALLLLTRYTTRGAEVYDHTRRSSLLKASQENFAAVT